MNIEIANRLQKLRKEKGYSQEQLADELGISRQAVSKWERAEASPDTDNLICLAKLYGISLDELLNSDETVEEIRQNTIESNESNTKKVFINKGDTKIIINSNDDDDDEPDEDEEYDGEDKTKPHLLSVIFTSVATLLVVIAFLLTGILWDMWHISWTFFLLIPVFATIPDAIKKRKPTEFAYPVLVTFFFCLFGMMYGIWHPLWVLFITIPIYYAIFGELQKYWRNKKQ